MRFGFLNTNINEVHRFDKREALIDGFILERSINIVYGQAGLGKTWALFAISKKLVDRGCDVVYLDSDNGSDIIKDRGYDKHIEAMGSKFIYINGDLMSCARTGMAKVFGDIEENAINYSNAVFIYDSITFFLGGGIYDEGKLDKLMTHFKKIRRAGGTVIAINHTTKKGDVMKGGGTLINSSDEVWEASKLGDFDDVMNFCFTPTKKRLPVVESTYEINTSNLSLVSKDKRIACKNRSHLNTNFRNT